MDEQVTVIFMDGKGWVRVVERGCCLIQVEFSCLDDDQEVGEITMEDGFVLCIIEGVGKVNTFFDEFTQMKEKGWIQVRVKVGGWKFFPVKFVDQSTVWDKMRWLF